MKTERLAGWLAPSLADGPVTESLSDGLRALIVDGRVVPGVQLPSERELAAGLGLSRATVTTAYNRLRGEGFLRSRRGAGTLAHLPSRPVTRPDERPGQSPVGGPDVIDLTLAALPAPSELHGAATAAAADLSRHLSGVGLHPMGLEELRAAVAERYTRRGLATTADQVLITAGSLHGWDILLRTLARPPGRVVVEQPTYAAVIDAALAHGARVDPLPVDATGWDTSQLARAPRPPVLAHVTFDGQNPTGLWAAPDQRRRLLAAFDPSTVIVADETVVDFPHDAPETRPAAAMARPGTTVITVGSMSKSFWAGLRIGWLRGPAELVRRLTAVRTGQDLAPPVLDQLVAVRLLAGADQLLERRAKLLSARRDVLLDALREHAPGWSVTPPRGGIVAWADLGGISSTRLAERALAAGVRVTPGPRFTVTGTHDRWLRLPFVLPPSDLEAAVERLARAAVGASRAGRRRRQGAETSWTV
jgi:DNA-binding transcriptional MocR family regulator